MNHQPESHENKSTFSAFVFATTSSPPPV